MRVHYCGHCYKTFRCRSQRCLNGNQVRKCPRYGCVAYPMHLYSKDIEDAHARDRRTK